MPPLETATSTVSVALSRGGELLCEVVAPPERPSAEVLLPTVDAVLAEAGVSLGAVGAFAVSIGPGSFTGLRIGVATLKGLAFGAGRPAVAVPTLLWARLDSAYRLIALGATGSTGTEGGSGSSYPAISRSAVLLPLFIAPYRK